MASDENMSKSGIDDGSLTVAKVRAPSTPFDSDTNPLSNFRFKESDEIVTIKNVEEIVKAVKDSFSRFIETQRNYAARESSNSSESSSSSKSNDEDSQKNEQTVSSAENDKDGESNKNKNELTEAVNSDIMKAASEENQFSQSNEILNSLDIFKDETNSTLKSFYDDISDKLINSVEKDENELDIIEQNSIQEENKENKKPIDYDSSFIDYIISSVEKIENNIDGLFDYVEEISEKITENSVSFESKDNILQEDNIVSDYGKINNIVENKDILGLDNENGLKNAFFEDFDSLFEEIDENIENLSELSKKTDENDISFENNENLENTEQTRSIYDAINEIMETSKTLQIGMDDVTMMLSGMTSDGLAESIVESMVQGSMIQMIADETVDGISSSLTDIVKEQLGESITLLKDSNLENSDETEEEFFNGRNPDETIDDFTNENSIIDSADGKDFEDFEFENEVNQNESEENNFNNSNDSDKVETVENGFFNGIKGFFSDVFSWFKNSKNEDKEDNGENETSIESVDDETESEGDFGENGFSDNFENDSDEGVNLLDDQFHPHEDETEFEEWQPQDIDVENEEKEGIFELNDEKDVTEYEWFDIDSEFSKFYDIIKSFENSINDSLNGGEDDYKNSNSVFEETDFSGFYNSESEAVGYEEEENGMSFHIGNDESENVENEKTTDSDDIVNAIKESKNGIIESINNLCYEIDNSRDEIIDKIKRINVSDGGNSEIGIKRNITFTTMAENQVDSFEVERLR